MTTQFYTLALNISDSEMISLKQKHQSLSKFIELGNVIPNDYIENLREFLYSILQKQPSWQTMVELNHYQHLILKLVHNDNQILNLPWQLALEKKTNIFLQKGLSLSNNIHSPQNPLPLKILVMVSSPEDSDVKGRLSFEEEELSILRSFDKLLETGQVQIDFTDDGSLENLKQKLHENHYHILHFSGHGSFNEGQGYLLVEEELSLEKKQISAKHFAKILNIKPEHLPDLVLLSSCQTAQGDNNSDFSGVANQLIQIGIPSVIAMGWSVSDYYATSFASFFYNKLSVQEPIHRAFQSSIEYIKSLEQENNSNSSNLVFPKQWMIPQLYTNGFCENIIDWNSPSVKLKYKTELWSLRQHHQNYYFVGRRRDRKEIIGDFFNKKPIWLKGQGGIGKSSMAEHLIQRLIAHEPKTIIFEQNETNLGLKNLEAQIINYLENKHQKFTVRVELDRFSEKTVDRLKYLFQMLKDLCNPVFLFDNLEDFQEKEDDPSFKSNFNDVEEMLIFLHQTKSFHIICTGRYLPPSSIEQLTITKNINQVSFSDFWKKSQQLELFYIQRKLTINPVLLGNKNASYENVIYLLYKVFGGNFRALEFFDELFKVNEKSTSELILQFQKLSEQPETQQTLQRISENLVFTKLLSLLDNNSIKTLSLLSNFKRPVITLALEMQDSNIKFDSSLDTLSNLTLIEKRGTYELQKYYVTPLVKQLLEINNFAFIDFNDNEAGEYYEYYFEKIQKESLNDYEEAFEHFFKSQNKEKVTNLGAILGVTYSLASMNHRAYYFTVKSIQLLGENCDGKLWNILGRLAEVTGDSSNGIIYYNKALKWADENNDFEGKIFYLSNKGQVYLKQALYDEALKQYQMSIDICESIGKIREKANILHSIGSIYNEQGQYNKALEFFNKGLQIARKEKEILVEANIQNSIAGIHLEMGERDFAFKIFNENYQLYNSISFVEGEINALNGISAVFKDKGEYKKALDISRKCLSLSYQSDNKRNIGAAFSGIGYCLLKLKEYNDSLTYLEDGLKVQQEINDFHQVAHTLNYIGMLHYENGKYPLALEKYLLAEKIALDTSNRAALLPIWNNIAKIHGPINNNINSYLEYQNKAYIESIKLNNAMGIFCNGRDLGTTLCRVNRSKEGIPILQKAYLIGLKLGYPDIKEIENEIQKCILSQL